VRDAALEYQITDLDVLNYTDAIKSKLAMKFDHASGTQYGTSAAAVTLSSLAGAANTAGWGVATGSGLGLGAAYVLSLGHVFDAKGHAAAYEQAFTAIQAAEANYYFHQTGMSFAQVGGKNQVVLPNPQNQPNHIPYSDRLTADGETLYYRVGKTLKVLDDVLASKIPDLGDLKESQGEGANGSPMKSTTAPGNSANTSSGKGGSSKTGSQGGSRGAVTKPGTTGATKSNPVNPPVGDSQALQDAKSAAIKTLVNMTDAQASAALGEPAGANTSGARQRLQDQISAASTVTQVNALIPGSSPN
jgi:hypothetical protein